jgi:hypothetical protein
MAIEMKKSPSPAKSKPSSRAGKPASTYFVWITLAVIILFFVIVRVRLLDVPLERDEGEYAYAGQLILQGIPPYKLAYNMKLPGTYAAYAVSMAVFGETASGIHLGLLLVNAATILMVFFLARKLFNTTVALVASASYALLSASPAVLGFAAHAGQYVVLFALAGAVFLLSALEKDQRKKFFASGLCFGLAFVMKQPGIFYCAFAGLWFLISRTWKKPIDWKILTRRGGILLAGMILPFVLTCLILWAAGVFDKFWFWTFSYARAYTNVIPLQQAGGNFVEASKVALPPNEYLWLLGAAGLLLLFCEKSIRRQAPWLLSLTIFSFLAMCPGFYFRQHYYIFLLPAWCLLIGVAVAAAVELLKKTPLPRPFQFAPVGIFLFVFGFVLSQHWELFFKFDALSIHRAAYGENPFIEAGEVARYIREHSAPEAKIAVLGSEPEIYFYAKRHSASGYIYMYPLMEPQPYAHTMQEEMIRQIETARPEFLLMVSFPFSWAGGGKSDQTVFRWFDQYRTNYESAGVMNYVSSPEFKAPDNPGQYFIEILKRK